MDSVSPTNQKDIPISRDQWDRQAERLIEWAKTSPELRGILVKALLRPGNYLGRPKVEMQKILTAFKVADIGGNTVYCKQGDISAFDRWRKVRELLLGMIRQELLLPLMRGRDVRQLKMILREIRDWSGDATGIDWKLINGDLKILEDEARRYESFPKEAPRRGRKLIEHQHRIIACVELLRQCGVRDPCKTVVEVLWAWGIKREWKTVSNLWSRYKTYRRRHPEREALPGYWVKGILFFIVPELDAWIQTQGFVNRQI